MLGEKTRPKEPQSTEFEIDDAHIAEGFLQDDQVVSGKVNIMSELETIPSRVSPESPTKRLRMASPHSPGSRGSLRSWSGGRRQSPSAADRRVNTHSALRRWKRNHEQDMMGKLVDRRNEKKQLIRMSKEDAKKIARKISVETLAREWLNTNEATLEIRAYLVDSVLPTLILGVEKLLNEADQKGLAEKDEMDPNFNPVNYLAQYLMRNNPRYSNFSEASPYVRGLRKVSEELRDQLFDIEDNRLARIKADAKRRREERVKQEQLNLMEEERRKKAFINQFKEWDASPQGKVELSLLQNALRTFEEISENFPKEIQKACRFSHSLESTDETGRCLIVEEFAEYLSKFVSGMPRDIFDQFMLHMSRCAQAHCAASAREKRRIILSNLFMSCDHSGIGLLDRHRILNLFEAFFDELSGVSLRNPKKWPVVEVNEADDTLSDEEELLDHTAVAADTTFQQVQEPTPGQEPVTTALTEENAEKEEDKVASEKESEKPEDKVEEQTVGENEAESQKTQPEELVKSEEEKKPKAISEGQESEKPEVTASEEESKKTTEEKQTKEDKDEPLDAEKVGEKDDSQKNSDGQDSGEEQSKPEVKAEEKVENLEIKEETETEDKKDLEKEESKDVEPLSEQSEITEESKVQDSSSLATDGFPQTADPDLLALVQTGRNSVSFAEGTAFERERTGMTLQSRSQSQASAFDENSLNVSQFVQLTETFLGDSPIPATVQKLMTFVKTGYEETDEEKRDRMVKMRQEAMAVKRKQLMDQLFEKWDNDGSGFLDQDEVEMIMYKYKDGQENETIKKARISFRQKSVYSQDNRLSKQEFRQFTLMVVDGMAEADSFDYFIEFLTNSVERSYAERIRGEARKKWLQQIVSSAETGGAKMEPVYRSLFQAIFKDAEAHGNSKMISANISMLERNVTAPERGDVCLRYVAATADDSDVVLGQILYKDMKGISFASIDSGKPIHVPRVANHGNIHFWRTTRFPEEIDGSFIVVPLKDKKKRVFGLLGLDTLGDRHNKAIFITHEIQYFQGIAKAFSIAYHHVDVRKKLLRITESAVSWIHRRSNIVREITTYVVEPDGKGRDYVLRRMMSTDSRGNILNIQVPPRLERKDNLFRDYLFTCVDNSETVSADAYGERHLAFPLRDDQGRAIALVDIGIGEQKKLPPHENKEIQRMLRLLQLAHNEITRESAGEDKTMILEAEQSEDTRMDVMFDRLMLMELRENVAKIDAKAFAELRSYNDPRQIIHDIMKAVLAIFYFEKVESGELDDWNDLKSWINGELLKKMAEYDPTASKEEFLAPTAKIAAHLTNVPHGEVARHGSVPAQHIYNWVFVCISLLDHTHKMRDNIEDSLPSPKSDTEENDQNGGQEKELSNL
ncbi:hypothetical protein ScPMuIL_005392 [Solemya velum]